MMVKRPNVSAATAGPHESRFFTWLTLQRLSIPVASHYKRWLLSGCHFGAVGDQEFEQSSGVGVIRDQSLGTCAEFGVARH